MRMIVAAFIAALATGGTAQAERWPASTPRKCVMPDGQILYRSGGTCAGSGDFARQADGAFSVTTKWWRDGAQRPPPNPSPPMSHAESMRQATAPKKGP